MRSRIYLTPVLFLGIALLSCNNDNAQMNEQTVNLEDESQKIGYALGISIAGSLKKQNFENMDVSALIKAIEEAYGEGPTLMTEEEANKMLNDYRQQLQQAKQAVHLNAGREFLKSNKTKEGVVTLESGLQYKVMNEGTGPMPTASDTVTVHYHGTFIDGTVFDSSIGGQPASFPVTGVIAGWVEALQLMKVGAKWQLYIPMELAYGPRGRPSIEPNMALIFDVELLSIKQ